MAKSYSTNVKDFYSRKDVVEDYDLRRFRGYGGKYIENAEIESKIQLITKYLKSSKTNKVLDLGAGRGRLSLPLSKIGYDVYCLDASSEMARVLRQYFPKKKLFVQSVFNKINTNLKFDAIVGLRFFDHFNKDDQKNILVNVGRNLKDNGFILFCALNKKSIEHLLSKFLYFGKVNFYYSDTDYRRMFALLNYKVVSFNSIFFLPRGIFLYVQVVPFLVDIFKFIDNFLSIIFPRNNALLFYLLIK